MKRRRRRRRTWLCSDKDCFKSRSSRRYLDNSNFCSSSSSLSSSLLNRWAARYYILSEQQDILRDYLTLLVEQQDISRHYITNNAWWAASHYRTLFDITCWAARHVETLFDIACCAASAAAAASSTTAGAQTETIRVSTTSSVAFPWPCSGPCACPEEGESPITNDDCTKLTMRLLLRGWIPIHLHPDQ